MKEKDLPPDFVKRLRAVTAKRAKTVIDHLLEHGHITTEELSNDYGYDHPPRAARDVRELGIPLETFKMTGSHGRKIGAYRFGDPSKIKAGKLGGRMAWPKEFKQKLIDKYGERCGVCRTDFESRYLQIDHRVPYEVAGDDPNNDMDVKDFMLACASCNRSKSWSCEQCINWTGKKENSVCESCYWATPESYSHVATRQIRRLDLSWSEAEVLEYDSLVEICQNEGKDLKEFLKQILKARLE